MGKPRRRKFSSKEKEKDDNPVDTIIQEESSTKKGSKSSSKNSRKQSIENVIPEPLDIDSDPIVYEKVASDSQEETKVNTSPLKKSKRKVTATATVKDAVKTEKNDLSNEIEEDVDNSPVPDVLKRTQNRKTVTIRNRKSKASKPVSDKIEDKTEESEVKPHETTRRLSSKLDNLKLASDPNQPIESLDAQTKRKAPGRKKKIVDQVEDKSNSAVEEVAATDEKPRPRRACKKKFDTLEGMADSPFNSPAVPSKETSTSEVAPKKSRTSSKKVVKDDKSILKAVEVKESVITEDDEDLKKKTVAKRSKTKKAVKEDESNLSVAETHKADVLQKMEEEVNHENIPKPRRNVGRTTSKTNTATNSKASLKPVKDALFKTPSVVIDDEMYQTPGTEGVVSVVTDQEYETPKVVVAKKRGRPRTKK